MSKEDDPPKENSENPSEISNIIEENFEKKPENEIELLGDALLRKAAELENVKKRLEKEKEDAVKYSNAKFAKDLLTAIDNFERVSKNYDSIKGKIESDDALRVFWEGVLLCEKELISTFKRYDISKIEVQKGDDFDPEYHQAISESENSGCKAGCIVEVFQTGYLYNDRLLRPAIVSVAR
jgi:molecular chaperone GrpE